ncbi:hypothetical protein BH23GEM9_BH23GEM9_28870 [soil metagenome]
MQEHQHIQTAAAEFLPHGFCYLWNPGLLWTHVTADFLIGTAYVVISVSLAWLVHRVRRDIPFSWVFVAFGLFIITCGLTHFMEIWTLWQPVYWLSGGVKIVTAIASVTTAVAMPFTVPHVVSTVRDASLSRQRELAETTAAALKEHNDRLLEQATELDKQREKAEELAVHLQAALTAAEAANNAKTAFLRTMSHELRTPLNAILGYEQLLEAGLSGPLTDQQLDQLKRIHRSALHLLTLVDEVLTLSRGEQGVARIVPETVNVPEIVASAVEMVEDDARAKRLLLVRGDIVDTDIRTDPGRLRQILLNLLTNAVKFTQEGSVTISAEREADRVVFRVTDTGPGIDAAHLGRVFEPFWQLEQTTTRSQSGSGLGLAVSRELATMLGGTLTVSSEPGRGSTFTLMLPVRPRA